MAERRRVTHRKKRAATPDVLGNPAAAKEKIRPKFRVYYDRLNRLRADLVRRHETLARQALEEKPNYGTHMADAGTDTYDRDLVLGLASSDQEALYEIDEALDRVRNGTYGICELTGKAIEPERLEAIPWTRFTAEAEAELEKEGAIKRARLGDQETVAKIEATQGDEESI